MKVIAMGYNWTGSSAIVHLLKEYENCHDVDNKNYEHNIFYTPHGLFDLEDVLLHNNTMYKCDAAIDDFYDAMKNLNDNDYVWFGGFQKRYGKQFMKIVNDFIDGLVIYKRVGGWSNDYKYEFKVSYVIRDIVKTILHYDVLRFGYRINLLGDNEVKYAFPTPKEFYSLAKVFVDDYFKMVGYRDDKVYVFDQILEPQQLYRINNYFDNDVRCIVVDRDPRDMFLLSKYVWSKGKTYSTLPTDDGIFSDFYLRLLNTEKKISDDRILRIHFEDLVYKYDDMVDTIEKFVGKDLLGNHKYKKQFFNPEQSVNNTQVFNAHYEWKKEVARIEQGELKQMIYEFPYEIKANYSAFIDPDPDTSIKRN